MKNNQIMGFVGLLHINVFKTPKLQSEAMTNLHPPMHHFKWMWVRHGLFLINVSLPHNQATWLSFLNKKFTCLHFLIMSNNIHSFLHLTTISLITLTCILTYLHLHTYILTTNVISPLINEDIARTTST
jgi:hypothetical protein